jgi:DNA-binding Lrp family transcriptional regulator
VDEIDAAIVDELQRDARQSNRDLAAKLGIAPSTCLERVRSLRTRGVINDLLMDRVTNRREIVGFRSSIVYAHVGGGSVGALP